MWTWSEMVARLTPWSPRDDSETRRLIDEARELKCAQSDLTEHVESRADYLANEVHVNGFTARLDAGFRRRAATSE